MSGQLAVQIHATESQARKITQKIIGHTLMRCDMLSAHAFHVSMRRTSMLVLMHISKNQITSNIVGNYVSFVRIKMCSNENRGVHTYSSCRFGRLFLMDSLGDD